MTTTDNQVFRDADGRTMSILAESARLGSQSEPRIGALPPLGSSGSADDRWVFTEENLRHECSAVSALAAASRVLKGFNDPLAAECLLIARDIWDRTRLRGPAGDPGEATKPAHLQLAQLEPAIELLQATGERRFAEAILALGDEIVRDVDRVGWLGARSQGLVNDPAFSEKITVALYQLRNRAAELEKATPYGLPYRPRIWGAGWEIQRFGVEQYFLHTCAPEVFPQDYLLNAISFILGCHPGANSASFVSGVGARSMLVAYGVNRGDWSHIPGGVASGTALIRPDFPELLNWPFLWQQGEYCLGRPTSDYVFLILAANQLLNPR